MLNIWTGIISVVISILVFLVGLFPPINPDVNASISSFIIGFKDLIAPVNYIFPVSSFLSVVGFIILIEGSIALYKSILWIGQHISAGFIKK